MIDYGKPASNQMALDLPGYSDEGKERMKEARRWVGMHFNEWAWFKSEALLDTQECGYSNVNRLLQNMRHKFRVSVKNAYAPCFARIAMEEDSRIKFKTAASKVDGFTTARLES